MDYNGSDPGWFDLMNINPIKGRAGVTRSTLKKVKKLCYDLKPASSTYVRANGRSQKEK